MRFPLALAMLFLGAITALPALAATPAPISVSLRDATAPSIEAVQYRQQTTRQRGQTRTYRNGYNAYGANPRASSGDSDPWRKLEKKCVTLGPHHPGSSAYPSWALCRDIPFPG
jgi:hypothetical protein